MKEGREGFSLKPFFPSFPSFPLWYPPILAYHRIHPAGARGSAATRLSAAAGATDTPTVPPEIFERQMAILQARWKPVPLMELVERLEKGGPLDRRAVALTFDDGTEDTFTHAFPILEKYQIPATVFVIADNVGRPGSLQPDQVRKMRSAGIEIGSHTLHHAYLPSLTPEQVREELAGSRKKLEALGGSVESLSYPAGGFSRQVIEEARRAGYRAACTTNRGFRRFPIDRWALRRIALHSSARSPWGLWIRCCGYYGLNRRLRPPA